MSESESPSTPFQRSSSSFAMPPVGNVAPRAFRPGGLTAICVIAICLGTLGILGSVFALGSQVFKGQIQRTFVAPRQSTSNNPSIQSQIRFQEELQAKLQAVADRYRHFSWSTSFVNLVIAVGLLAGGISVLRINPTGRTLLTRVFAAAVVFVIVRVAIGAMMQVEMGNVLTESMSRMIQATPRGPAGTAPPTAVMTIVMKTSVFLGMAVNIGWAAATVVFYVIGIRYLCRPSVRQLFGLDVSFPAGKSQDEAGHALLR